MLSATSPTAGRDPRTMTRAELEAMGHRPLSPMQAIRAKCLDCCAGSADEVRKCGGDVPVLAIPHRQEPVARAALGGAPESHAGTRPPSRRCR